MNSPVQQALQTHRNHYLFSDYYLANRLHEQPEWAADVAAALADFTARWRSYQPQADNESQTEADWIRPVLIRLGHTFNVQVALDTPFGTRKPDYVLFADEAGRQAAKAIAGPLTADHLRDVALAVADAKAWERDLDRAATSASSQKGLAISDNPMLQIYIYVQHSGLAWGLVTNGRLWRLVHRARADKLDVYYEVDLPALIEQGDADAFKFFYLFFRREAFTAPPGQPAFLERVLSQSRAYNRGISDNLKDQVYEALRCLAQGFLDFPPNRLDPTPAVLHDIYTHSLIVLYRLLFILYAESRDLLPVAGPQRNPLYSQSYSLEALKRRISRDLDQHKPVAASMAHDWHYLRQLWQVIDRGNPDLDVLAYDGGLFSEQPEDFLARYRVGDKHLRRAIDLLARTVDPQTKERRFVDYRDLEIRHLGSIYEGLLEYRLRRAEQPLAVRVEKGRELYEPIQISEGSKTSEVSVQPGELYLITDKGERKATGSYYTPDYIVEYIVEQTVGPLLDDLRQRHADDPAALERAVLDLNVLDPSMGSGHFLVEATNFMALRLVELALPKPPDAEFESDLAYWRRRVAQACLYGVDVNPLAVELAKLSLWLTTVARGKPLSFLDHHLRHGNSLVGSRVADLPLEGAATRSRRRRSRQQKAEADQRSAGQLSMLDDSAFVSTMRTATGFMDSIERLRGETLAEVQEAADLYRKIVTEVTAKVRQLADIWTARAFGLELADELWPPLARHLTHGGLPFAKFDQLVAETETLARQHQFFHWELEFPEVFFDQHGRLDRAAGFDAVIGNPPYVRQERLQPYKPYFEQYYESFHSVADLYLYFYERGIDLAYEGGRLAYISSGTFARANFAKAFRKWLPQNAHIETIIDFGENQPFEGAEMVRPSIVTLKKGQQIDEFRSLFIAEKVPEDLNEALAEDSIDCLPKVLKQAEWTFEPAAVTKLFEKTVSQGTPLDEFVNGAMYYGVKTGLNAVFIIDQEMRDRLTQSDPSSTTLIKPMVRGQDLRPWYQENEGNWLIVLPAGWTAERFGAGLSEADAWSQLNLHYPGLTEYLGPFAEDARKRYDKGEYWWELRSCDYYPAFERPKIFWPDICKLPRFSWDENNQYINNTGYIVPDPHPSLLGILQSRVLWFAVSQICQPLRLRAGLWQYRMIAQFMSRLPIPDAPAAEREAIGELAMQLTELAKARYQLHRQSRHRILSDLGASAGQAKLNQKLTAWWELDFPVFRGEVKKIFKQDIPLKERDEWEGWLLDRQAKNRQHTQAIIRLESALNARVYALFKLTPAEIALIEESTKYRYGEV
jgi:hypothetical protein